MRQWLHVQRTNLYWVADDRDLLARLPWTATESEVLNLLDGLGWSFMYSEHSSGKTHLYFSKEV